MEKNVQRMYGLMGLFGELLAIFGVYLSIKNELLQKISFTLLSAVLLAALIVGIVLFELKKSGKFESLSTMNAYIAKGHIALMLGMCILITAMMQKMNKPFFDTLAVVLIVIVFLSAMLAFMIKIFTKLMDMVKESEKE